jgi:Fatty acid hydroxylase superfamily
VNTTTWMIGAVAVPVVTYYATTFVQVVFHRWFGHTDRLSAVFEQHLHGHHDDYRLGRLTSKKWIEAERHIMWYYALPLAPLSAVTAWLMPWPLFVLHAVALGLTIWWHIYLHQQYHLDGARWERFAWFRRKRELHLRHHVRHHGNYAIVEFFWDRLFGTYDQAPLPSSRRVRSPSTRDQS